MSDAPISSQTRCARTKSPRNPLAMSMPIVAKRICGPSRCAPDRTAAPTVSALSP
jgi:hypothetical protein